jgi:hypothetical protein
MTPLTRFWFALEALPGQAAVGVRWRALLGDDHHVVARFCVPDGCLATSYPRAGGGEPYAVVEHGPDEFVGVSEEDGTTVPLSRADLVVYRVDPNRLLAGLAEAFGFEPDGGPVGTVPGTYRVGLYRPLAGFAFPAFLTLQTEPDQYRQSVESVAARAGAPFLLLSPTNRHHRMGSALVLQARQGAHIALADATALGPDGRLRLTEAGGQWLEDFRCGVLPGEGPAEAGRFFPTPPGATWRDLRLRFLDGHTVSVEVGGVRHRLSYEQMGMADGRNGKPTLRWELLHLFGEGHGKLTWDSRGARPKLQKQRENLARDLKAFFRIGGEPIVLTADKKGWQTVFSIVPDT